MRLRPVLAACLGLLLLTACAAGGPLGAVTAYPPSQSPDARDQRNRLNVQYQLSSPAVVSARIVAADGQQWTMHERAERPRAGDYVFQFDGTVPGPGANERRVLASGDYRVVLEATAGGQLQQAQVPLTIRDADTALPDVTDMTVLPDRISPDFDAREDVAHLTFRLAKDGRVAPYLDRDIGDGRLQRVWMGEELRATAGEQALVWDGLASGIPVPTGNYMLGVRARDAAGNVVERSAPLVVEASGIPVASIVSARIGPRRIIRGEQVCLDAIVRNSGLTVLRTEGPDPGYIYNSNDTYSSIEDHRFGEHAGYWRVGLNWSGGTDISGATYPYRWGFGKDLQPGEEVTVHGCVSVHNEQDKLVYFAGLVQENVAIHSAGAGLVRIEISS